MEFVNIPYFSFFKKISEFNGTTVDAIFFVKTYFLYILIQHAFKY